MAQHDNELRLDPMFTKNKRSVSAKARAARQKAEDPDKFAKLGGKGGRVTGIKKGFAAIDPEVAKEIQAKGVEARKAKKEMIDDEK